MEVQSATNGLEAEARRLLEAAPADPKSTIARAEALSDAAVGCEDWPSAALAQRAGGLAHLIASEPVTALAWLDRAAAHAERSGDPSIVGGVQVTMAAAHSWAGDSTTALASIDAAVTLLHGVARDQARVQRGTLRYRAGDLAGALRDFDAVEQHLVDAGDTDWLARLYGNRGIVLGLAGRTEAAERDLTASMELFRTQGHPAAAAQGLQNLGWVYTRSGDLPRALSALDQAEVELAALGQPLGELWGDRTDALLAANLTSEAKELAQRAADLLTSSGMAVGHAEALLRLALAALLDKDPELARQAAVEAQTELVAEDRAAWADYAAYLVILSRAASDEVLAADVPEVRRLANRLERSGFLAESVRARALVAELELAAGDRRAAHRDYRRISTLRSHASFELRIAGWLAEARLRTSLGNQRGADAAARAGLRVAEDWQATMGGAELRALVAGRAAELADLGLDLAYASGSARRVFRWMERTRAGALRFAPVRPPDDADLAVELAALREAEAQYRSSQLSGMPDREAEQSVMAMRRSIRRRSRRRLGDGGAAPHSVTSVDDVHESLQRTGVGALVEIGVWDGFATAVMVTSATTTLRRLGSMSEVRSALESLQFSMRRIASPRGSPAARGLAAQTADAAYVELETLLLGELRLPDGPVVVVPPAELHSVPWGLLPQLRGRAVAVTPSARLWVDRVQPARRRRRGVVVAHGPDLPGAAEESCHVARLYDGAQRFTARSATVGTLLAAMDGARVAHLVAHGSFRADNPLFSSLRFADGALTVYDLERIDRMPSVMVLSACNSGLQAARPGNETMGIVAALLAAGCRTVVASTGLVPDTRRTARTMEEFHRRLVRGQSAGEALAGAQMRALQSGEDGLAAASFVCFGAG